MKENFVDRIEKKLGRYALHNLSFYMLVCFAIGYALAYVPFTSGLVSYLELEPSLILKGQVWRLFTWIISPPRQDNIFWVLISMYFYYSIGRTLEMVWGDFRYNVYIFSGMFYTIIGAFIMYAILFAIGIPDFRVGTLFTTYYVCMSIFLAFAATFPEMEVMLMFIIPVKVKVLGVIYAAILIIECLGGGILVAIPIIASLFNFLVFMVSGRKRIGISKAQQMKRKEFRAKTKSLNNMSRNVTKHKCAICGRTDESNPELEFRFCSKCNGNYEYCNDHLFTHKHVE
ncbi:MAG: hypothetical protein J5525_01950 [Lachnospiraceae bacterium]|nr:hypothetical protein [Lachnospiraceae bacterium]